MIAGSRETAREGRSRFEEHFAGFECGAEYPGTAEGTGEEHAGGYAREGSTGTAAKG